MSAKAWVFLLVGAGVVLAIVIGVFAQSESVAQRRLCSSLASLQNDVADLKDVDPSTMSRSTLESTLTSIQSDWENVKSDARDVVELDVDELDKAWADYTSEVRSLPENATVSDATAQISEQTQALVTSVQATVGDLDCS